MPPFLRNNKAFKVGQDKLSARMVQDWLLEQLAGLGELAFSYKFQLYVPVPW